MKITRLFALCLLAFGLQAETKPNLTGTWKQDNSRSTVSARPNSAQYSNKIEHEDPKLAVTTMWTGGSRPDSSSTRNYTTDGKPDVTKGSDGDQFTTIVKWDGNTLVFEREQKEPGRTITSREAWSLSEDGKTLTKTIHSTGPQGERDQKFVLVKQ